MLTNLPFDIWSISLLCIDRNYRENLGIIQYIRPYSHKTQLLVSYATVNRAMKQAEKRGLKCQILGLTLR